MTEDGGKDTGDAFFIHFLHLFFVQGDADVAEIFSQKFRRQHLRIASHLHICHKFS